MKKYSFRSSFRSLLFNLKIEYIFNPWILNIDFQNEILEIKQRNWFLVGYKTNVVSLRFIKNISIKEHLFGSDIHIKTMGQNFIVKYIEKSEAEIIRNLLLDFNKNKGKQMVIM